MKKALLWIGIGSVTATIVGAATYEIYQLSEKQSDKTFIMPKHTTINEFFQNDKNEAPIVKESFIAGEKGYVVSQGPVRVSSAYSSLFDKNELIKLAKWINENISWGANAISLKNITFTTGVDKGSNGTTKGFHTAGRDGSAIFISPDAFEDIGNLGSRTFKKIINPIINKYETNFEKSIDDPGVMSSINSTLPQYTNDALAKYFNGTTSSLQLTGNYKTITKQMLADRYKEMLKDVWQDDFVSKIQGQSQMSVLTQGNKYGDHNFTAPERLSYLIKEGKLDQAINKRYEKIAFDTAYKLVWDATGGSSQLGNIYLQLALKEILFDDGYKEDGKVVAFGAVPRSEWSKKAGISKSDNLTNLSSLGNGYFKQLTNDGLSTSTSLNRARIYQLFVHMYDQTLSFLNSQNSVTQHIHDMWNDKVVRTINAWINAVSRFSSTDRVRWLISGKFPQQINLSVLLDDEWMLNPEDLKFINNASKITDRVVDSHIDDVSSVDIAEKVPELGNKTVSKMSVSDFYKTNLIDSMKYTISHEYGHHETMWSTYGIYGNPITASPNVYENTIGLYSDSQAAKGEDHIDERTFNILREFGKGNPGIRSALDVMMRSGDKYSSTWTPGFDSYNYFGYNPGYDLTGNRVPANGKWGSSQEDLWQASLNFGTGPTGAPQISLDDNEYLGTTPIEFNTNGIDSTGNGNSTKYLFSIDRSKMDNNNPAKSPADNRIGDFFRMLVTPDQMLMGYQMSQWLIDGKQLPAEAQWRKDNPEISLPQINGQSIPSKPTVQFTPILAQDPGDHISKMFSLEGLIRIAFGLSDTYSHEVILALDEVVKPLYDRLIQKYPNMFEIANGKPAMTSYERSSVIYEQVIEDTKKELMSSQDKDHYYDTLKGKPGVYFDPKTLVYMAKQPENPNNLSNHEFLDYIFDQYKKSDIVTTGNVQLGTAQSGFTDYTGSFPEFMTRIVNQLQFRPDYDNYFSYTNQSLDTENLTSFNEGWYDDINRFHGMGMDMYKIDVSNSGTKGQLTETGAMLLNWYRETLGLHVDLSASIPKDANGDVDYAALDNMVQSADPLTKVFKNKKTNLTTMWGWIPNSKVGVYKNLVLIDKQGKKTKIEITTKNTSHYFYRETMNNLKSEIHLLNNGYTQWVANWEIVGDYVNATIESGEYTMLFEDGQGKTYNPFDDNHPTNSQKDEHRNSNDYNKMFAQIEWTTNIKSKSIKILVKG